MKVKKFERCLMIDDAFLQLVFADGMMVWWYCGMVAWYG